MSYDDKVRELERLIEELRDADPLAIELRTDLYVRAVTLVRECKEQLKQSNAALYAATQVLLGES